MAEGLYSFASAPQGPESLYSFSGGPPGMGAPDAMEDEKAQQLNEYLQELQEKYIAAKESGDEELAAEYLREFEEFIEMVRGGVAAEEERMLGGMGGEGLGGLMFEGDSPWGLEPGETAREIAPWQTIQGYRDGGLAALSPRSMADAVESKGRYGDSMLVHMNPAEVQGLASLGGMTINPETGRPEFFIQVLAPLLSSLLGPSLFGALGMSALPGWLLSGLGSFIATTAATGDIEKGLMTGLIGGGLGAFMGALGGAGAGAVPTDIGANSGLLQAGAGGVSPTIATSAALPDPSVVLDMVPQDVLGSLGTGNAMQMPIPMAEIGQTTLPGSLKIVRPDLFQNPEAMVGDIFEGLPVTPHPPPGPYSISPMSPGSGSVYEGGWNPSPPVSMTGSPPVSPGGPPLPPRGMMGKMAGATGAGVSMPQFLKDIPGKAFGGPYGLEGMKQGMNPIAEAFKNEFSKAGMGSALAAGLMDEVMRQEEEAGDDEPFKLSKEDEERIAKVDDRYLTPQDPEDWDLWNMLRRAQRGEPDKPFFTYRYPNV